MGAIKEDIFLRQLENTMVNSVSLRGVKDIKRVFLLEHDKVTNGTSSRREKAAIRPKERTAMIWSQIEREMLRQKDRDHQWDDQIDVCRIILYKD